MIVQKHRAIIVAGLLGVLLLGGCQSVHKDLKAELPDPGKPSRKVSQQANREVQVPDLDERKEDTQFLSKIDRLQQQVFDLTASLKASEEERDAAVKDRDIAQTSESTLAGLIEEFQASLASASAMEKKLKSRLIRSELESVRYQQIVADMKIRELTKGAGK